MNNDPDYIDPHFGIPLAIVLWTILVIIILISLRLAKLKRDASKREELKRRRRETFIQIANKQDEEFLDSLKAQKPKETKR